MADEAGQNHASEATQLPDHMLALAPLLEAIVDVMVEQTMHNLAKYPDITDPADPRLLEPLPAKPLPAPPAQWVYFIADGRTSLIKIGTSIEVKARLSSVARKRESKLALVGTVRGGYQTEATFHRLLAAYRVEGEWFRRGPWFDIVLAGLDAGQDAATIIARLSATGAGDG